MFRLMNPSALFAFEVTVAICLFQLRSEVRVIPRYLADLTFSRMTSWRLYWNLIGFFLRVIEIVWHLVGLNCISHLSSHLASVLRSS